MNELIKCAHCKGKGICYIDGESCTSCIAAKRLIEGSIVRCDCCLGLGETTLWNLQTRESTSTPIEETLTGYSAKSEQETIRILDRRRFIITIAVFIVGVSLIVAGIVTNNLNVLLPVASSLMTGAIGYYIGGQLIQSKKDYEDTKQKLKQ